MTGTDADLRRLSMDAAKEVPAYLLKYCFQLYCVLRVISFFTQEFYGR